MTQRKQQQVGAAIRTLRQQRELSLSDVATDAGISVATLSRIETSRQSVDVDMLTKLSSILGTSASALLGGGSDHQDVNTLATRLAELRSTQRAEVIRTALERRRDDDIATTVDGLLATLDVVRAELESLARATRRRSRVKR